MANSKISCNVDDLLVLNSDLAYIGATEAVCYSPRVFYCRLSDKLSKMALVSLVEPV